MRSAKHVAVALERAPEHDATELLAALAAEGCTVTALTGALAVPASCGALLVVAATPLDPADVAAVRAWVAGGGALLVAGAGTDALVPDISFGEPFVGDVDLPGDESLSGVHGRPLQVAAPAWSLAANVGIVAARVGIGAGHAVALAGEDLLATRILTDDDEYATWAEAVLRAWLPMFGDELARRLRGPQRHRLLQAYPMAPAMGRGGFAPPYRLARPSPDRAAVVGVLPHPYCNPAIAGCGFCTFPHEPYARDRAAVVGAQVVREINAFRTRLVTHRHKDPWPRRRVEALYLGGGTANLTPPDTLRAIGEELHGAFDLDGTEVTFEGVPLYFTARKPSPLDLLREVFPHSAWRVSLGIQTFAPAQLARMGRAAFGDAADFARVTEEARARGFTTSADMLFDLPGQTRDDILADARAAADLGLDQVCFYHLVMFDGLETEWSRDKSLLAQLPDNAQACENWLALREELLRLGYVQTSLTDFERRDALADPRRRFRYEPCVFEPERCDQLGFGPAAVTFWGAGNRVAWKLLNPTGSEAYLAADPQRPWERDFAYGARDWAILYLTRKIAALGVDRAAYLALHGRDVVEHFAEELAALADAGLVAIAPERIDVTPRGMFHADAIAGLLAWRMQAFRHQDRRGSRQGRDRALDDEAVFSWMG